MRNDSSRIDIKTFKILKIEIKIFKITRSTFYFINYAIGLFTVESTGLTF